MREVLNAKTADFPVVTTNKLYFFHRGLISEGKLNILTDNLACTIF